MGGPLSLGGVYGWSDRLLDGSRGVDAVRTLLRKRSETLEVRDVQSEPSYRAKDIDLLWTRKRPVGPPETLGVEVKWDRYTTGNVAFETLSVVEQKVPGCFLSSEADLWYYCFPRWGKAYVLPLARTRAWFLEKGAGYPRKVTSSHDTIKGVWHTEFAVLPIMDLLRAVPEVEIVEFSTLP